jgi:hypothetical protein
VVEAPSTAPVPEDDEPGGLLADLPRTEEALDTYLALPSDATDAQREEAFDDYVRSYALDQIDGTQEGIDQALAELQNDRNGTAWSELALATAESDALSTFILAGPTAEQNVRDGFEAVQQQISGAHPEWADVTADEILADPELAADFIADAEAYRDDTYGFDNTLSDGTTVHFESPGVGPLAAAMGQLESGYQYLSESGFLESGLSMSEATQAAETRLGQIAAEHPEIAFIDHQDVYLNLIPPGTDLSLRFNGGEPPTTSFSAVLPPSLGGGDAGGGPFSGSAGYAFNSYVYNRMVRGSASSPNNPVRQAILDPLTSASAELDTLRDAVVRGQPGASDLLPTAQQAVQLLGLVTAGRPDPQTIAGFEHALDLVQGYQDQRTTRTVVELGLAGVAIVGGVVASLPTAGASLAATMYGLSITAGVAGAGLSVDRFIHESQLSQYRGGGLDLSGIDPPNGNALALELALTGLGVHFDVAGFRRAYGALGLVDEMADAVGYAPKGGVWTQTQIDEFMTFMRDGGMDARSLEKYNDWFREAVLSHHPELANVPPHELLALYGYSADGFAKLNPVLRSQDPALIAPYQQYIDAVVGGLEHMPTYQGTVYRGINSSNVEARIAPYLESLQSGEPWVEHGFLSTSIGGVADNYQGNIELVIESTAGHQVQNIAYFGHAEREVLFPPGTAFDVLDVQMVDGKYVVYLREIP